MGYFGSYFGGGGGSGSSGTGDTGTTATTPGARDVAVFTDDVLLAIRKKLSDDGVCHDDYVYLALEEEAPGDDPPCDQFVVVVPGPQRPEQPLVTGAAADTLTPVAGQFGVILWTRLDVDQDGRDTDRLTHRTLGALKTQRKLLKSLQLFDPLDDQGHPILSEPMRLADPGFDCRPKRPRSGWSWVANVFTACYNADLVS